MLARWNPWQELFDLQREMSDMVRRTFGGWFGSPFGLRPAFETTAWAPAVDVFSRDGDLVVRAELPGVDPEKDIDISVQEGVLSIRGERKREARTDGQNYFRVESSYGAFQRHIPLPEGVKPDDIRATYENGILEVVVPRAAQLSSPKKIPITVGTGRKALTTRGRKK
jgi:HSP20 family protein